MNVELDEEKIKVLVEEAGLKAVQTIVRGDTLGRPYHLSSILGYL